MTIARPATETVAFIDEYAAPYRDLFSDVRSFDHVTHLHRGLIRDVARKAVPALARSTASDPQARHHCIAHGDWAVNEFRQRRLPRPREAVRGQSFILGMDETGDQQDGTVTADVSRQAIGNRGTVETGRGSVNADGVRGALSVPLRFQVCKPDRRRHPDDTDQTTPASARARVRTLVTAGCSSALVRADALDGARSACLDTLGELGLPAVVAMRAHHARWLPRGQHVRAPRWRRWARVCRAGRRAPRVMRDGIDGLRRAIRCAPLTREPEKVPMATPRVVMTNLPGELCARVGKLDGLRTWMA